MQTFVVEVLDEKAVPLLRDLENLDIIRLLPGIIKEVEQSTQQTQRPSERFWGCISKELAADLHRQLDEMRNEWERDI